MASLTPKAKIPRATFLYDNAEIFYENKLARAAHGCSRGVSHKLTEDKAKISHPQFLLTQIMHLAPNNCARRAYVIFLIRYAVFRFLGVRGISGPVRGQASLPEPRYREAGDTWLFLTIRIGKFKSFRERSMTFKFTAILLWLSWTTFQHETSGLISAGSRNLAFVRHSTLVLVTALFVRRGKLWILTYNKLNSLRSVGESGKKMGLNIYMMTVSMLNNRTKFNGQASCINGFRYV
jgi:hypothetical protein